MAELIVQQVDKDGVLDLSGALAVAAAGGDSVRASSGLLIVMENLDVGAHTLTITKPQAEVSTGNFGDATIADIALVVAAGDTGILNVPNGYQNSSNDFAWTYDDETSVSVGVFSLSNG